MKSENPEDSSEGLPDGHTIAARDAVCVCVCVSTSNPKAFRARDNKELRRSKAYYGQATPWCLRTQTRLSLQPRLTFDFIEIRIGTSDNLRRLHAAAGNCQILTTARHHPNGNHYYWRRAARCLSAIMCHLMLSHTSSV